jgi:hypothetical protein
MATTSRNLAPPNLPVAPENYERRFIEQFSNSLRLFFSTVTNAINSPKPHGSYYDTTTQANAAAVNAMKLNSTVEQFAVRIGSPTSRILVSETGIYNIQFSAQLDKDNSSAHTIYIWLRINGVDVPHSASKVTMKDSSSEMVLAWNFVVTLRSGDYFEIMWSSTDSTMVLLAEPAAGSVPQIPSVILTVTWVSGITLSL